MFITNPIEAVINVCKEMDTEALKSFLRSGFVDAGCYGARMNTMMATIHSANEGGLINRDKLATAKTWSEIVDKLMLPAFQVIGENPGDIANWITDYIVENHIILNGCAWGRFFLHRDIVLPHVLKVLGSGAD